MKFDELCNIILTEDVEEDAFLDALDGAPKKELVVKLVNDLITTKGVYQKFGDTGKKYYLNKIEKLSRHLLTMSKNEILKYYIKKELENNNLDIEDIELMVFGVIKDADRAEEKRKRKSGYY